MRDAKGLKESPVRQLSLFVTVSPGCLNTLLILKEIHTLEKPYQAVDS